MQPTHKDTELTSIQAAKLEICGCAVHCQSVQALSLTQCTVRHHGLLTVLHLLLRRDAAASAAAASALRIT
eukprot:7842-Heterococcus_DN1.PRE.2